VFAATALTTVVVALCILVHYLALNVINSGVRRFPRHRLSLLAAMYGLFIAHAIEIWIFAAGYATAHTLELGAIVPDPNGWLDYAYFSAMVYTTVGFGDLIPAGPMRVIAMAEALAGLSLITWSASFTFLEMQRLWR
jgi:hypothetical protein